MLMAILDERLRGASNHIWLYHQWFGYKERFEAMLMHLVLDHELYKNFKDLSDAVKAFLQYDNENFHIVDAYSDRNYLAFVDMVEKRAIWCSLYHSNSEVVQDMTKELENLAGIGVLEAIEAFLEKNGVSYQTYRFDEKHLKEFCTRALVDVDILIRRLEDRMGKNSEYTKYWVEYEKALRDKFAKYVNGRFEK